MKTRQLLLVVVALGLLSLTPVAADWPQWRGPDRNGISKETGLLKEWPKEGPKLLWQVKNIGNGYSTPAVVGERLYLVSNEGMDKEFVQALSVKDGQQVWSTPIGKVGPNIGMDYAGARSTPTVDGEFLYALGSNGEIVCLQTATGKLVWQKSMGADFGGKPGSWAYSESLLIDGNVLVGTPGGAKATLVALNKKTGAVIWQCAVPGGDDAAYASVQAIDAGGRKQYVQFLRNGLVGVDAATGKFLWRYDGTKGGQGMNMQTPVAHDGFVYSASQSGGALVQLKDDKGAVLAAKVYDNKTQPNLPNSIGGEILVAGHLYGTSRAGLVCVEFATGKEKWSDKCIGAASVCYADGMLYVHGENGQVAFVEATPEAYREKGRFTPVDQPSRNAGRFMEKAWTYPVVANGRFYIHDIGTLWCYDVKAPK